MEYAKKSPLHFGIVGCGMIAAIHAQAIRSLENACLIGAVDADRARAVAFAENFGIRAYGSYAEMLADKNIDAVCICTPSGYHAKNAMEALCAGKHTVVEKPMAMTGADAVAVLDMAKKQDKFITVISQLRFSPDVIRLKQVIEEGKLGRLRLCDLYMKYWREKSYYSQSGWKGDMLLDGGVLMNQGIHGIDLLRYLVGEAAVVGAVTDRLCHQINAPDTALALLRYECGALGVIEASTAAFPGFALLLEIIGENGYARLEEDRLTSLVIDGEEQIVCRTENTKRGTAADPKAVGWKNHTLQLENFIRAINEGTMLCVDGRDGCEAVALIEKIYSYHE